MNTLLANAVGFAAVPEVVHAVTVAVWPDGGRIDRILSLERIAEVRKIALLDATNYAHHEGISRGNRLFVYLRPSGRPRHQMVVRPGPTQLGPPAVLVIADPMNPDWEERSTFTTSYIPSALRLGWFAFGPLEIERAPFHFLRHFNPDLSRGDVSMTHIMVVKVPESMLDPGTDLLDRELLQLMGEMHPALWDEGDLIEWEKALST